MFHKEKRISHENTDKLNQKTFKAVPKLCFHYEAVGSVHITAVITVSQSLKNSMFGVDYLSAYCFAKK